MKSTSLFISIFLLFYSSISWSQNEHMIWHFGQGAGLNFSSGNPVPMTSAINTHESCYTVNDPSGNVLFYTNGVKVWDATDTQMPNGFGLMGNTSAQTIVVPKPGSTTRYYIFTTDATFNNPTNGFRYSEIDLTLNNGNGDVIPSMKNVLISPANGEWLTAVPHANCTDTWILTHGDASNSVFKAFHVSANGVNPVPVETDLGITFGAFDLGVGLMKPSPDGSKIAMTWPIGTGTVGLIDFDQATGQAAGMNTIFSQPSERPYGVEFSRSGDVMYVGVFGGELFQFDMTSANIAASITQVGSITLNGEIGVIQIAPNDKIYVNYNIFPSGGSIIGVINNPEIIGAGCNFVQNALSIAPATSIYGLPWYYSPNNIQLSPLDLGMDTLLCQNEELVLTADAQSPLPTSYSWSDGSISPTLLVNSPGTYWVERQIGSCPVVVDTIQITFDSTIINRSPIDTSGCMPFSLSMTMGADSLNFTSWSWDMGNGDVLNTPSISYTYDNPGSYAITLQATTLNNCVVQDTVSSIVEIFENPVADFVWNPQLPEEGEPILFIDNSSADVFAWEWSDPTAVVSNSTEFSYTPSITQVETQMTLVVTNQNNCTDSIKYSIPFASKDLYFVPNTFTPNGDGSNDAFRVIDFYTIVSEISIYNRWGELIWYSEDSSQNWDGTYKGEDMPDGVYNWKVIVSGDTKRIETGHVSLIR